MGFEDVLPQPTLPRLVSQRLPSHFLPPISRVLKPPSSRLKDRKPLSAFCGFAAYFVGHLVLREVGNSGLSVFPTKHSFPS